MSLKMFQTPFSDLFSNPFSDPFSDLFSDLFSDPFSDPFSDTFSNPFSDNDTPISDPVLRRASERRRTARLYLISNKKNTISPGGKVQVCFNRACRVCACIYLCEWGLLKAWSSVI